MLDNKKYKEIRRKRLNNFLLFYTFIILFLCFNMTISKYGAIGKANSNISIAAWKIKINNENIETSNTFVLNNNQQTAGAQTTNNKIAPDSNGYFEIILDLSDTEVSIDYKLEIDTSILEKNGISLQLTGYSINGGTINQIENNTISGEKILREVNGKIIKFTEEDNCNIKIYWNWTADIENPEFTGESLKINVNAIVQQKLGDE